MRAAFDRLVEGIKTADAAKVMSVYNKSEDILFFNNNGSVTRSWETMRVNREASYKNASNVTLDPTGVRIEMLGTGAAYLTCKRSPGRAPCTGSRVAAIPCSSRRARGSWAIAFDPNGALVVASNDTVFGFAHFAVASATAH